MSTPAIETADLRKVYGDEVALVGLDLSIEAGTVYGFLGPNGAGKTTTIKILTTLTRPTSGGARIAGAPIHDREAVVDKIGYLPEQPPVYGELTGRENLEYVAGLRGFEDWDRIEELLDRFALAEDADRRVDTYSKGMKQKLGLVMALMHEPEVLFLDEPTAGLDPRAARTVRETIATVGEDVTVFLSTHILPVVEELADAVGVLYEGELVAEGAPDDLVRQVETGRAGAGEGPGGGRDGATSLEDVFLEVTAEREAGAESVEQ